MQLKIRRPDDFHVHLRDGALLQSVLPYTAQVFGRGLIMGNLKLQGHQLARTDKPFPPVLLAQDALAYRERILAALPADCAFQPLMTIVITDETTPDMIMEARKAGVIAGKIYPKGLTTNSEWGISRWMENRELDAVLEAMQKAKMVLCLHGEAANTFCLDREKAFLPTVARIARQFPRLRIVLEHITTGEAVKFVVDQPATVGATITVHHLELTLDDVVGGLLHPHHFCKPIAKRPEDRLMLLRAIHEPWRGPFFLGTDSAPHLKKTKECADGCAGVFSAPVAMSVLARVFEREETLKTLQPFASEVGAKFYGLPFNKDTITLVKEPWRVPWRIPCEISGIVPYRAGETLEWKVEGMDNL